MFSKSIFFSLISLVFCASSALATTFGDSSSSKIVGAPIQCSDSFEALHHMSILNHNNYKVNQLVKATFGVLFGSSLSAHSKSLIWEHMVREQGIYRFYSYKIMIDQEGLDGYVYLGSIANEELKTGLYIDASGEIKTFHLTDEILRYYSGRVVEVDGNLTLKFSDPMLRDWFLHQVAEMIHIEYI